MAHLGVPLDVECKLDMPLEQLMLEQQVHMTMPGAKVCATCSPHHRHHPPPSQGRGRGRGMAPQTGGVQLTGDSNKGKGKGKGKGGKGRGSKGGKKGDSGAMGKGASASMYATTGAGQAGQMFGRQAGAEGLVVSQADIDKKNALLSSSRAHAQKMRSQQFVPQLMTGPRMEPYPSLQTLPTSTQPGVVKPMSDFSSFNLTGLGNPSTSLLPTEAPLVGGLGTDLPDSANLGLLGGFDASLLATPTTAPFSAASLPLTASVPAPVNLPVVSWPDTSSLMESQRQLEAKTHQLELERRQQADELKKLQRQEEARQRQSQDIIRGLHQEISGLKHQVSQRVQQDEVTQQLMASLMEIKRDQENQVARASAMMNMFQQQQQQLAHQSKEQQDALQQLAQLKSSVKESKTQLQHQQHQQQQQQQQQQQTQQQPQKGFHIDLGSKGARQKYTQQQLPHSQLSPQKAAPQASTTPSGEEKLWQLQKQLMSQSQQYQKQLEQRQQLLRREQERQQQSQKHAQLQQQQLQLQQQQAQAAQQAQLQASQQQKLLQQQQQQQLQQQQQQLQQQQDSDRAQWQALMQNPEALAQLLRAQGQ